MHTLRTVNMATSKLEQVKIARIRLKSGSAGRESSPKMVKLYDFLFFYIFLKKAATKPRNLMLDAQQLIADTGRTHRSGIGLCAVLCGAHLDLFDQQTWKPSWDSLSQCQSSYIKVIIPR